MRMSEGIETKTKNEGNEMTIEEKYEQGIEDVKDAADWSGSPLLPPGWMFKQEGKRVQVYQPGGNIGEQAGGANALQV